MNSVTIIQIIFMKKSLRYSGFVAGTAIILFSCQKADTLKDPDLAGKSSKQKKNSCFIASFSYSNASVPSQTIFKNHYDASGRTTEVDAGVFSGGSVLSTLSLDLKWAAAGIAFTKARTITDTVLFAFVSKKGQVDRIVPGNQPDPQFLSTSFEYEGNQISALHITIAGKTETSYFNYDNKGNPVSITDAPTADVAVPGRIEYEYATSEKAKQQFYLDEPRKFSWNSFSLLQYIGLFPELQPVNLRTATKVTWGNNYQAYNMKIGNQQLDQEGKLVGYDIIHPQTGNTISHYSVNWKCSSDNNGQNNQDGN